MDIETLKVFQSPYKKVRYGKNNDGGYVISFLEKGEYDLFLSAGVSDDISFEEHFLKDHENIQCIAYDGTISSFPSTNNKTIRYINKNISPENNMSEYINSHKNIFLKMDIEGHEYDWINSLTTDQLNNMKQIVMEFHLHLPSHWELPLSKYCNDMINKINQTHYLVHLHPNNCMPTKEIDGKIYPIVFECTFLRKDCFEDIPLLSREPIPGPLDQINVPGCPPVILKGYPFN